MKAASLENPISYYYAPSSHHGLFTIYYSFFPPPRFVVYIWDFILVRILMFILYFTVPIFLIWYTFIKQEYLKGGIIISLWSLLFSLVGCWIWLFTYMNYFEP